MVITPTNPHDAYLRRVLTQRPNVGPHLRAAVPKDPAPEIDWSCMEPMPCSFVSQDLRSSYSDLLFRTRYKNHDAFLYFLVEHQSSPDRMMPLRMLRYMTGVWTRYLDENPHSRTLPVIIPIVIHNNHTGRLWSGPTQMADLYDADPAFLAGGNPYLPRFQFVLDDIAAIDAGTVLQAQHLTAPVRALFYLQKVAPNNTDMATALIPLIDDLRAIANGPGGADDLIPHLTYILLVRDTPVGDLVPVIDQLGNRAKETLMTTAD
ncbi:Rpn family recombination-promoting nuclease/putative transposase, partial [Streptomyces roseolus]|uniref:Rpn family recombination-promoting nuclease/putative transposase n=1 Tax=Streptomyces roseolus TaxID=67358 RepID=UPI003667503F